MSSSRETFTKDLEQFHSDQKHYLDASGNFIGYSATDSYDLIKNKEPVHYDEYLLRKKLFEEDKGIVPTGLSNVNFGHITNPVEFGGTMIQDLGWVDASSNQGLGSTRVLRLGRGVLRSNDLFIAPNIGLYMNNEQILMEGELTAPLVEAQDEQGAEEETQWHCKGCSKYFATKASLKRHHERKKSCKELSEKPTISEVTLPDKP